MASRDALDAARQYVQAVGHPLEEGSWWKQLTTGRRQFNRQRQAVQVNADGGDRLDVRFRHGQVRLDRERPLQEECNPCILGKVFISCKLRAFGQRQRGNRELVFSLDMQHGAACHQDFQVRAGNQ